MNESDLLTKYGHRLVSDYFQTKIDIQCKAWTKTGWTSRISVPAEELEGFYSSLENGTDELWLGGVRKRAAAASLVSLFNNEVAMLNNRINTPGRAQELCEKILVVDPEFDVQANMHVWATKLKDVVERKIQSTPVSYTLSDICSFESYITPYIPVEGELVEQWNNELKNKLDGLITVLEEDTHRFIVDRKVGYMVKWWGLLPNKDDRIDVSERFRNAIGELSYEVWHPTGEGDPTSFAYILENWWRDNYGYIDPARVAAYAEFAEYLTTTFVEDNETDVWIRRTAHFFTTIVDSVSEIKYGTRRIKWRWKKEEE